MQDPLVSVNMITYNHEPYIRKAIDSVLEQKVDFPFELVIGEDCSTDGTREIVFDYAKRYPDIIRVITSEQNVGMRKNGYRTGQACRGKYIAWCEGDDYWHNSEKLQKQVHYMEIHPDCGLVYSDYDVYHVKSKKKIKDFIKYRNYEMPIYPTLLDFVKGKDGLGLGILTCSIMLRRVLYENIKESDPYLYQSDHFLMGDTQLWAEMATISRLGFIPESLVTHLITVESATRSKDIKKEIRFSISSSELFLYLCEKYNLPANIRDKHVEEWCNSSLRLAFYSKNSELADEVRKKKIAFTLKEWIRYYGAHYLAVHYGYLAASLLASLFRKENKQWQ